MWVPEPSHPEGGSWQYEYAITNVEYTGAWCPLVQRCLFGFEAVPWLVCECGVHASAPALLPGVSQLPFSLPAYTQTKRPGLCV